jgi:hypothetical protein
MSAAMNFQQTADQLTAAALQSYVAMPVNLGQTHASMGTVLADTAIAKQQRMGQTLQTIRQDELQENVQMVTVLNESINANMYLHNIMGAETARVGGMDAKVKNEQFKLRNRVLMDRYMIGYYSVATAVVIMTLIVTLLLLLPAALWRAGKMHRLFFAATVMVIVIVYLAAVVATVARTSMRRSDAWNQFNWKVTKSMAKDLADANANRDDSCEGNTVRMNCEQARVSYMQSEGGNMIRRPAGVSEEGHAWADYLIREKRGEGGVSWPGDACREKTSCEDAAAIYTSMYGVDGKPFLDRGAPVTPLQHSRNNTHNDWATSKEC